jgi:tripartite-type tricarboxylate transporter receptor subunit TctC
MKLLLTLVAALPLCMPLAAQAQAQAYPNKPITVVVPFPAGGTMDNLTRMVSQKLSTNVGQSVIVENKPGAGTTIGTEYVSRAKGDGYTLGMVANSFAINPSLYDNLKYKTIDDFTPIAMLALTPHVLVAKNTLPASTVAEVVAMAKKTPGRLTFASFGNGTSPHIAIEMFKSIAGVDVAHVPYKGQAPALNDLLGGHVDFMFTNLPDVLPHIQTGKLRAIAIVNPTRANVAPNIPTFKEAGYPTFESNSWFGVIAPKDVPADVLRKLSQELDAVLKADDVRKRLSEQGLEIAYKSPDAFKTFLLQEMKKAEKAVKASGATVN